MKSEQINLGANTLTEEKWKKDIAKNEREW